MIILRLSHQAAHLPLRRKRVAHSDTTSSAAGAMRTTSKATIPPRMTSWWNFWRRSWRESVGFWRKKVQTWCEILPKNVYVSFHRFLYIYISSYPFVFFFLSLSLSFVYIYTCTYTSSTAQGGGGSSKNRKPIGEIVCCESGMAERSHWWTERCLRSPLFLSLSLTIYLPTNLSSMYLSIYRSISLSLSFI